MHRVEPEVFLIAEPKVRHMDLYKYLKSNNIVVPIICWNGF